MTKPSLFTQLVSKVHHLFIFLNSVKTFKTLQNLNYHSLLLVLREFNCVSLFLMIFNNFNLFFILHVYFIRLAGCSHFMKLSSCSFQKKNLKNKKKFMLSKRLFIRKLKIKSLNVCDASLFS